MPSFMNCTDVLGLSRMLMPPTMALGHRPLWMAWYAFCRAMRLDEHAVSRAMLGPGQQHSVGAQRREPCGLPWEPRPAILGDPGAQRA